MKSTFSARHGKLMPDAKQTSPYDGLPLPGGKKIPDTSTSELIRLLQSAGVPGVDHAQGRHGNLSAYAKHLDGIRKAGADAAEAAWIGAQS